MFYRTRAVLIAHVRLARLSVSLAFAINKLKQNGIGCLHTKLQ